MLVIRALPNPEKRRQLETEYQALNPNAPKIYDLTGLIELNGMERTEEVQSTLKQQNHNPNAQAIVKRFCPLITQH